MEEMIVAIDIGTSKICISYGTVDDKKSLKIKDVIVESCSGLKKGIIVDINGTSRTIRKAMDRLEKNQNIKVHSVYTNISGGHVRLLNSQKSIVVDEKSREITVKDVKRLMYSLTKCDIPNDCEIVDIIPNQYILDGYDEIIDPIGMHGTGLTLDATLVLGKTTSVKNIIKSIENADLKVNGILLGSLADSDIVFHVDEKDTGALLINTGAGITDFSFFNNGRLQYYDSLPVGGGHITNDIAIGLKISHQEAEKNKRKFELALTSLIKNDQVVKLVDINNGKLKDVPVSSLVEIIEARVNEMFSLVKNRLLNESIDLDSISNIVITGGGLSYVDGAVQLAKEVFEKPVRIAKSSCMEYPNAEFVTSIGIVDFLASGKKGRIKFSSITDLAVKEEKQKETKKKRGILSKIFKNLF